MIILNGYLALSRLSNVCNPWMNIWLLTMPQCQVGWHFLCQSCKILPVLWQSPPVPAVATLVFWSWHQLNWRQLTCLYPATHCSNDLIICVAPADQSINFWPGCNYGLILLIGMMRGWHQFVWLEVNLYMLVDDSLQNLWHGAEQSNRSPVTQSSQIPTKLSFQCISAYLLPLPICKYL